MKYSDCIKIYSKARLNRYEIACNYDKQRTVQFYNYNIQMCQCFYGILCTFEIMLRNLISEHYSKCFGHDWMVAMAVNDKFSDFNKKEIKEHETEFRKAGNYSNDKMIASFTFGFWTRLFTKDSYRKEGKILLQIFKNKPQCYNKKQIYDELKRIRYFRNRVAYYEPICFNNIKDKIRSVYVREQFYLICNYVSYFDYDPKISIFFGALPEKIFQKLICWPICYIYDFLFRKVNNVTYKIMLLVNTISLYTIFE